MTQTDALPGRGAPIVCRSRKEVNRYYASRPAPAGRGRLAAARPRIRRARGRRAAPPGGPVTAARSGRRARLLPRAAQLGHRGLQRLGVATDAAIGSPTASVSRLITPRLIGRGIRASVCAKNSCPTARAAPSESPAPACGEDLGDAVVERVDVARLRQLAFREDAHEFAVLQRGLARVVRARACRGSSWRGAIGIAFACRNTQLANRVLKIR
jgi:hypothetical protein